MMRDPGQAQRGRMLTNIRRSGDSTPRVDADEARRAQLSVCRFALTQDDPAGVAAELMEALGLVQDTAEDAA